MYNLLVYKIKYIEIHKIIILDFGFITIGTYM